MTVEDINKERVQEYWTLSQEDGSSHDATWTLHSSRFAPENSNSSEDALLGRRVVPFLHLDFLYENGDCYCHRLK